MTRNDFCNTLSNSPYWSEDRYGNYQYIGPKFSESPYRFKVQKTSARLEYQIVLFDGKKEWRNFRSDYFKNIVINANGSIKIGGNTLNRRWI